MLKFMLWPGPHSADGCGAFQSGRTIRSLGNRPFRCEKSGRYGKPLSLMRSGTTDTVVWAGPPNPGWGWLAEGISIFFWPISITSENAKHVLTAHTSVISIWITQIAYYFTLIVCQSKCEEKGIIAVLNFNLHGWTVVNPSRVGSAFTNVVDFADPAKVCASWSSRRLGKFKYEIDSNRTTVHPITGMKERDAQIGRVDCWFKWLAVILTHWIHLHDANDCIPNRLSSLWAWRKMSRSRFFWPLPLQVSIANGPQVTSRACAEAAQADGPFVGIQSAVDPVFQWWQNMQRYDYQMIIRQHCPRSPILSSSTRFRLEHSAGNPDAMFLFGLPWNFYDDFEPWPVVKSQVSVGRK